METHKHIERSPSGGAIDRISADTQSGIVRIFNALGKGSEVLRDVGAEGGKFLAFNVLSIPYAVWQTLRGGHRGATGQQYPEKEPHNK